MLDAVVIGAGPNGLVAAAELARHGWSVLVVEAKNRPGGALYSEALTLPGYVHDVGAAFFPFAVASPAFRTLDLCGAGLKWAYARRDSAHPAPDGSCATISREIGLAEESFGKPDGAAWRRLARWAGDMGDRLPEFLLAALPDIAAARRLGLGNLTHFGLAGLMTSAAWSRQFFESEAARRVVPGLALHVDLGPDDLASAGLGLALALLAAVSGFPVPVGGARSITDALLQRLHDFGGSLQLGAHVDRIIVREGRGVGVQMNGTNDIGVRRAVIADTGAPALFLRLLPSERVPNRVRWSMRRFRYGWGTFKVDWALGGPVPWRSAEAREAAVVHAGDSIADLTRFTEQVRAGRLPENPYLVIGQQSLLDPSRAPRGGQTLWCYSHVPSKLTDGWARQKEFFADQIERRIESLAPGFRALIRGRAAHGPDDLERMDENLVGGDLGGGSAQWTHQLFFRPAFPYFRHRTPVRGVYLGVPRQLPAQGCTALCGYNAAHMALRDCG